MYRAYEDPYGLEEQLQELEEIYADNRDDIDLYQGICELKDRINFAWQDNEYYHDNYDYADEMWMWENCYNSEEE